MVAYKKDLHIGHMIQAEMERQGRSASWLVRAIFCERSNVYKLFNRESISVDQLIRISEILDHDFLQDCYED
jgi:plasmid maintenance system antidote protein VapI